MRVLLLPLLFAFAGCIGPVPLPLVPLVLIDGATRDPTPWEARTYPVGDLTGHDAQAASDLVRGMRFVLPDSRGGAYVRGDADEIMVDTTPRLHAEVARWLDAERASRRR